MGMFSRIVIVNDNHRMHIYLCVLNVQNAINAIFICNYPLSFHGFTSQKHGGAIMNSTRESLATEVREINVVSQPASIELGTHKDKRD